MRRLFSSLFLAGALLALPASAGATQLPPRTAQVTGKLTSVGGYSFTVQTPGRATGVINALTVAANRVAAEDLPYVWGGGHGQAGIASVGIRGGPGFNGRRRGFDCSGSVAAVLVGGGLWPTGASVPNDAGVIQYLLRHRLIARGAGIGPQEVTLYDRPGVHIFMNIDGRFFGTSDGGRGGDARGGPGWLDDGAWDAHSAAFRRYHLVPGALRATTDAGNTLGFQFGPGLLLPAGLPVNARVRVAYRTTDAGTMVAESVTPLGQLSATGTIQSIAPDDSSFTMLTDSGRTLSFPVAAGSPILTQLTSGQITVYDRISLTYLGTPPAMLTLIDISSVTPPTPNTTVGQVEAIGAGDSSLTVLTAGGRTLSFPVAGSPFATELADGQIAIGDSVSLSYLGKPPAKLMLLAITVKAAPQPTTTTTTTTTTPQPQTVTSPAPPQQSGGSSI